MRLAAAFLLTTVLPFAALAQDRPNTMIVMDGSGSMWGQIEGVNKIVIAREVLGTILDAFPAEENLGLTVYGHRERGSCADIETVVPSGPGTVEAIREAANAINPRGKTPMTDAIVAAAEALRFTEERATVVLVSDGVETCNPDPCAAARALEQAGIDFTAHVVGFDVTDPEALAQMRCLADETGGTFTTASNAAELTVALQQVTVAAPEPEPEPVPVTITFSARLDAEDGPMVDGPVFWTVTEVEGERDGNPLDLPLETGSYEVEAYWAAGETAAMRQFVVGDAPREIVLVFETPAPTATLAAPATAVAGTVVEVGWNGPGAEGDFIGIRAEGATGYHRFENMAGLDADPVALTMPIPPGDWVIEYVSGADRSAVAEAAITITPALASVTAPATAPAGATVEIGWTGPAYDGDFLGVRAPDRTDYHRFVNTAKLDGPAVGLTMPAEPGDYLIEYVAGQNRSPLAAAAVTVEAVGATVTAPATATAGETVEVTWTGPAYENDFIGVRAPDATGYHRFVNATRVAADGAPVALTMPNAAGPFVIEYIVAQDREPIAATEIVLSPAEASVTAPASAVAGETVEVAWTGPAYRNDFIGVRRPDATGYHRFVNSTRVTADGAPVALLLPPEAGPFVIEYIVAQDRAPIAATEIALSPAEASVTAPASGPAGGTVEIGWTGPAYRNDFIGLRRPDAEGYHRFATSKRLGPDGVVTLTLPEEPGPYVVEYIEGQGRAPLSAAPLEVTAD